MVVSISNNAEKAGSTIMIQPVLSNSCKLAQSNTNSHKRLTKQIVGLFGLSERINYPEIQSVYQSLAGNATF